MGKKPMGKKKKKVAKKMPAKVLSQFKKKKAR